MPDALDRDENWSKKFRHAQPKEVRRHETIGGGWIVIARTLKTKRLRPAPWPVELPTREAAQEAAKNLAKKQPDTEFTIWRVAE